MLAQVYHIFCAMRGPIPEGDTGIGIVCHLFVANHACALSKDIPVGREVLDTIAALLCVLLAQCVGAFGISTDNFNVIVQLCPQDCIRKTFQCSIILKVATACNDDSKWTWVGEGTFKKSLEHKAVSQYPFRVTDDVLHRIFESLVVVGIIIQETKLFSCII